MQFLGGVPTRFVHVGVIEKGHTFVDILALIHNYQGYSLVCCEDHVRGILSEGFDGLPFFLGDVASVSLLVFVVVQNLWFSGRFLYSPSLWYSHQVHCRFF